MSLSDNSDAIRESDSISYTSSSSYSLFFKPNFQKQKREDKEESKIEENVQKRASTPKILDRDDVIHSNQINLMKKTFSENVFSRVTFKEPKMSNNIFYKLLLYKDQIRKEQEDQHKDEVFEQISYFLEVEKVRLVN